jgi:cysteine desulfurase/selenocysteine lyase
VNTQPATVPSAAVPDWEAVRRDFPLLVQGADASPEVLYFDSAASSQKPEAVLAALDQHYREDNANVHRGMYGLSVRATDAYEGARATVAAFLGASGTDEIVFTSGTTASINLVAQTWGRRNLRPGSRILLTELEHHSNLVPWQLIAAETGAELLFVPVLGRCGSIDEEALGRLLVDGVSLFAFPHISNSTGTINPAAAWCARARALGITTLVDGAQSAGHIPVDVSSLGCDFFAFSGHKMCAPTGIGALYGRREMLASLPPWMGGGEMIESVRYEQSTFREPPARFEAGTPPIAPAIGLGAACRYLEGIGLPAIAARDESLTESLRDALAAIPGIEIIGPAGPRGALVSFTMKQAHPHDVVTFAASRGLCLRGGHHCTQPLMRKLGLPGTVRASLYFYNTPGEIERAAAIIADAARFFS